MKQADACIPPSVKPETGNPELMGKNAGSTGRHPEEENTLRGNGWSGDWEPRWGISWNGCFRPEKPVMVKDIINTESRFNNRRRKEDWLTPTATQLLRTHLNLVEKVCRILPVSGIGIGGEPVRIYGTGSTGGHLDPVVDYQCGPLYGYRSIREALEELQDGRCLLCGERAIEHDHHLVLRSKGGSNTLANMAGLCEKCHTLVHTNQEAAEKLEAIKAGSFSFGKASA